MSYSTIKMYLGSLFFIVGYVTSVLVFGILLPFVVWLAYPVRYRILTTWARFIVFWLRLTCGIRHQVEGQNIPFEQPMIIFSRHESTWETIVFATIFPNQVWVIKKELLRIPFFGWAIHNLGAIAIDRSKRHAALKQLVEQGNQALADGRWVILFPEGTRMAPQEHKKFNIGGAMLAAKTQVSVLPVWHNAGSYWQRDSFLKKPGTITVRIGPRIDVLGKKTEEINQIAQAWIDNQR